MVLKDVGAKDFFKRWCLF